MRGLSVASLRLIPKLVYLAACRNTRVKATLCPMKLRTDLLAKLTPAMILEGVVMNTHRYKPGPRLSKTGVGSLSSASTAERAKEDALSTAIIRNLIRRSGTNGKKRVTKR